MEMFIFTMLFLKETNQIVYFHCCADGRTTTNHDTQQDANGDKYMGDKTEKKLKTVICCRKNQAFIKC
jgi:hypothetical protein